MCTLTEHVFWLLSVRCTCRAREYKEGREGQHTGGEISSLDVSTLKLKICKSFRNIFLKKKVMSPFQLGGSCVDFCLLLLTLLHATPRPTDAFNLDVRFPVVKEGSSPGSLFGLSVAFHKQTEGQQRYLVLVGAPKEKSALSTGANQTGDAFFCPISTERHDCGQMNLVTSANEQPDLSSEIVDGMWLGVSVASQNITKGRVMACGHRYVRKVNEGNMWSMIGRCYIRSNNMQYDPNDHHWQEDFEVCSPFDGHLEEGMCTMGISAAITENEVIVGSPGSFEWQGNADIIWRSPTDEYTTRRTDFRNLERRNVYMGYSVAKAKGLLNMTSDTLVTGAPRDGPEVNLARGAVILTPVGNVAHGDQKLSLVNTTLYGEQVGSYFGGSIAIADLNNDSWMDLIVGAPFYFDRTKEEGGAVYIYMNENGSFRNKYNLALRGPEKSAFGMAVAAIGDINQDGFQDFAVGAPFHGTGSVFVWMGSEKGISPEPSQVIKGQDIKGGGFQTFGYSVSGGMDIDNNKYPDIVVGSLDDRIAVLRARPVIHLQSDLNVTPDIVDPENCNDCVEATVCLSYTLSTGESVKKNITVEFTLVADRTSRSPRLQFLLNKANSYTGFFYMPSDTCKTFKLRLKKPIQNKVEPVSFSLNMSLYEPSPKSHGGIQSLDVYPVLSEGKTEKHEIHFQKACGIDNRCNSNLQMTAQFASSDNKSFQVNEGHQIFKYSVDVKTLKLLINVTNIPSERQPAEDAHNTLLNITIPPSLQFSSVNPKDLIECKLDGPDLLCEFRTPVRTNQRSQVQIIFQTSGISLDTRAIQTEIQLSTLSDQSAIPPLSLLLMVEYSLQTSFFIHQPSISTSFSGKVNGELAMNSTRDVGSPVKFTFEVALKGRPLGSLGTLQISFNWPYEVANGKWLLYLTRIVTEGTSSQLCIPQGNVVNPLNLTLEAEGRRKRELQSPEMEEEVKVQAESAHAQAHLKSRGVRKKAISLNCDTGGAKCQPFNCPLVGMNNSAKLIVYARLWNSTMLEHFCGSDLECEVGLCWTHDTGETQKCPSRTPSLDWPLCAKNGTYLVYQELGRKHYLWKPYRIQSEWAYAYEGTAVDNLDYTDAFRVSVLGQATLKLNTNKAAVIMKPVTRTFTVVIEPELEDETPDEAPVWIIVVSVLAGVLLLSLIVLLLWKCGFFRRASTRELYEAKAQKAEMKTQPSENDRLTEDN